MSIHRIVILKPHKSHYISLINRLNSKIMVRKTVREIAAAWKEYKRPYVKKSTMAAYALILENHILPCLGDSESPDEDDVQGSAFTSASAPGCASVKYVP